MAFDIKTAQIVDEETNKPKFDPNTAVEVKDSGLKFDISTAKIIEEPTQPQIPTQPEIEKQAEPTYPQIVGKGVVSGLSGIAESIVENIRMINKLGEKGMKFFGIEKEDIKKLGFDNYEQFKKASEFWEKPQEEFAKELQKVKGVKELVGLGAEGVVQTLPTIFYGMIFGPAGGLVPYGLISAGKEFKEAEKEGQALGKQFLRGTGVGAVASATEAIPLGRWLKLFGGKQLAKKGSLSLLKRYGKNIMSVLTNIGTETMQEVIEEPATNMVRAMFKKMPLTGEGGIVDVNQMKQAFKGGLSVSVFLSAFGLPASAISRKMAERALDTGEQITGEQAIDFKEQLAKDVKQETGKEMVTDINQIEAQELKDAKEAKKEVTETMQKEGLVAEKPKVQEIRLRDIKKDGLEAEQRKVVKPPPPPKPEVTLLKDLTQEEKLLVKDTVKGKEIQEQKQIVDYVKQEPNTQEGMQTKKEIIQQEKTAKPLTKRKSDGSEGGFIKSENIKKLSNFVKKYFTRSRGVLKEVDKANDIRIGEISSKVFDTKITGKQVKEYIKKNPATEEVIYNALIKKTEMTSVPEEIRPQVIKMRSDVDNLSSMITKYGALKKDTETAIKRNLGKYLVREYKLFEKGIHYEPSQQVKDNAKEWLKKQRAFKDLSDNQIKTIIEDMVTTKNFTYITKDKIPISVNVNHYIKRKNIPKPIRELFGEIKNPVYLYVKTMADLAVMAETNKFFNDISKIPNLVSNVKTKNNSYEIPYNPEKFGSLSGKYVDKNTNDFLMEYIEDKKKFLKLIENFVVNPFKWTKTVGSLPTHARNFISNFELSRIAGNYILNPKNLKYYKDAFDIIINKETTRKQDYKNLIKNRVVGVQFWGGEIKEFRNELLKLDPNYFEKILKPAKISIQKLSRFYNNQDEIFRIATFIKLKEKKKMSNEKAAEEVDSFFPNYAKVPLFTKELRKYAILGPFISFNSEIVRIHTINSIKAVKQAKQGNYRLLLTLLSSFYAIDMISAVSRAIFDVDDDEIEKLEKLMPSYRRGGGLIYYRNGKGQLKAFDLSFVMPLGNIRQAIRSLLNFDAEAFMNTLNFAEHPIFSMYSIINQGKHPFYDVDISNKYDPAYIQLKDRITEMLRNIYLPGSMPIPEFRSLLRGKFRTGKLTGYNIKPILDAANKEANKYGEVKSLPEEIKNFLTGIRTFAVDPEKIVNQYVKRLSWDIKEERDKLKGWLKNNPNAPKFVIEDEKKKFERRINEINRRIDLALSIDLKKLKK